MKNVQLNQKYGRLTIIEQIPSKNKRKRFKCICECGNHSEIDSNRIGITLSCGCLAKEMLIKRQTGKASNKFIDLTGKIFERLTVIERVCRHPRRTEWMCKCQCGTEKVIDGKHLKRGKIISCGCFCLEINSKRMKENNISKKIHGLTDHPLRAIRKAMLDRCNNKNNKFFKNYGGRGINVCITWVLSLQNFYDWAIKAGWEKGLSIDRINNDSDYTPENCQWITVSENSSKNCVLGKYSKDKYDRNNITT